MLAKMKVIIILFLFSIHAAFSELLKSCSEENEANRVCRNGKSQSYPIKLDTKLYLREIVKINEEDNSIKIQMAFINNWKDFSLSSSNETKS